MTISILTFMASGVIVFLGQVLTYYAKAEESTPSWLEYWGYVFFVFAAVLVIIGIVEFFKSIARSRRRRNYKRETARTLPKRPTKQKRR